MSQMEGKEMMRANRFAQVIAMDFAGTDYTDFADSIREDSRFAIVDAMHSHSILEDDMFFKWAERHLPEAEFYDLCKKDAEQTRRNRERQQAICAEAIRGGWLTEEEVREIAC